MHQFFESFRNINFVLYLSVSLCLSISLFVCSLCVRRQCQFRVQSTIKFRCKRRYCFCHIKHKMHIIGTNSRWKHYFVKRKSSFLRICDYFVALKHIWLFSVLISSQFGRRQSCSLFLTEKKIFMLMPSWHIPFIFFSLSLSLLYFLIAAVRQVSVIPSGHTSC